MPISPELEPQIEEQLRALIAEVLRVNQQFNLTAVRDADEAWIKHIIDSLRGLDTGLFDNGGRAIDIGTGPGFPGLPLAIARPRLRWTLLDATRKKCDFLRATIESFELNAKVVCGRAEALGQDKIRRASFDLATLRAVGSLPEVLELSLPLLRVGGHVVLWRGAQAEDEAKAAKTALRRLGGTVRSITPYSLPGHETPYHLVAVQKTAPTPAQYPRRDGLPKHQPLL